MSRIRAAAEDGFAMVELIVATVIMAVALTALVGVFASSLLAMGKTSEATTAAFLADAQLEAYRAMTSRDIGVDVDASVDSTYTSDPACANPDGAPPSSCAADGVAATETGPTGASPDSCSTIDTWYPNTLPCDPSRMVTRTTTPASPDGRSYRVDTYVVELAALPAGARARKQVTVVVRDGSTLAQLVRETSIFDCSTGETPGSSDC